MRPNRQAGLVRKEGVLVFSGEVEGDVTDVVRHDRKRRLEKVSGLGEDKLDQPPSAQSRGRRKSS